MRKNYMKNLNIKTKILFGFGIVILFIIALTAAVIITSTISASNLLEVDILSGFQLEAVSFEESFTNARLSGQVILSVTEPNENEYESAVSSYENAQRILAGLSRMADGQRSLAAYRDDIRIITENVSDWKALIDDVHANTLNIGATRGQIAGLGGLLSGDATELYNAQNGYFLAELSGGAEQAELSGRHTRIMHAADILLRVQTMRRSVVRMIDFYDMAGVPAALSGIEALTEELDKFIADSTQQTDIEISNTAKAKLNDYIVLINEFIALVDARNAIVGQINHEGGLTSAAVANMMRKIDGTLNDEIKTAESTGLWGMIITIALSVIAFAVAAVLAFYIAGIINRPLTAATKSMYSAVGNLDKSIEQFRETSGSLAESSNQQAAAIEETSATMNETSSMIAQNAENTRQAAQLASQSKKSSESGREKMRSMVQAMNELKESSDVISKIIKTIDDIAFQTNLLAINATIEAARAGGDAGRSFAVVADEVRSLAQKSADSAAETTEIIEKNMALTNTGREISREVADALETITNQFTSLNQIISEINAASEEQASGVKQINVTMTHMEQSTQSNAAASQELAASSKMLKELSDELEQVYNAIDFVVDGKKE